VATSKRIMGDATSVAVSERCVCVPGDRWLMTEFKIGQYVYYVPRRAEGRYVVMRLLPQPKGAVRYIIRSQAEPDREYTAEASELRTVPGAR
jgi:hypothetical protein